MERNIVEVSAGVKVKDHNFYRVDPERLEDMEELFTEVLTHQADAFEPMHTVDSVMRLLRKGLWQAFVTTVEADKYIQGITLTSIRITSANIRVLNIEFSTLQNFFLMAQMYEQLELLARDLECDYIETMTLPTVAEYAVRHKGFAAPYVYLRKPINYGRMN